MTTPLFSLLYTSARPSAVARCIEAWDSRAVLNQHEWILTFDPDRPELSKVADAIALKKIHFGFVRLSATDAPFNCVKGWNVAATMAKGKVLIVISDDFTPCEKWDEKLKNFMGGKWMDQERVLLLNDGYLSDICTIPVITRKRYEALGYVFFPGYSSMFCDTDLTVQARQDDILLNARSIGVFEHLHPDCQKRERDGVDMKHASLERYDRGQRLFHIRKTLDFPKEDTLPEWMERELDPGPQIQRMKFAALFVCNKDDFCLTESAVRLQEQGVNNFFFAIPDETWAGVPTPEGTEDFILNPLFQSKWIAGPRSGIKTFPVSKYREMFSSPMNHHLIEAQLRTEACQWVWDQGFDHVLIVDADELWIPGALSLVANLIEIENPKAIGMSMIPVAGLPGYPIEGAKDAALVYLRKGERFKFTRGPDVQPQEIAHIQQRGIYHFSATRRTFQEIVNKHLKSGHYEDPSYAMDDWIKNTLPFICPNFPGPIHMYREANIWPSVRAWIDEEKNLIPQTLHQYLGFK